MKTRTARFVLAALALAGTAAAARAQTAAEILEKMIAAQGGRTVLAAIRDTTISGSLEMLQFGMTGSLTMYQKEPDKMRMDIEVMGTLITQATDGEKAWNTDPQSGAVMEMPERQARDMRRQALGNDAILQPAKLGIVYAFKGREKVQDKEYLVLEQKFQDGEIVTVYVDPATFLIYKSRGKAMDQTGAEVEAETVLSDYRKVGETTMAHAMTVFQNGTEAMRMTFTRIAYNTGLKDELFRMAKAAQAVPTWARTS